MSCSKCGTSNTDCGCKDTPYTTPMPANSQPNASCPTPSKCSEYMDAACVYLNDGIYDANIPPQTSVEEAIQQLTLMITNPECTDTDSCNCPTAPTILLQTNTVDNSSQTVLNLTQSYGMNVTSHPGGGVSFESYVRENKAIYVDLTYGNNISGQKYNLNRPYATIAAATGVATAGDIIVLNAGTYTVGNIMAANNISMYCKPGVILNNSGFIVNTTLNWNLYGYAVFTGSGVTPFTITGGSGTGNISIEFDKIDGEMTTAVLISAPSATEFNLKFNCNSIKTITGDLTAQNCFRINNSLNANININVRNFIVGDQRFTMRIGGYSPSVSMVGTVNITCPIIMNSSTMAQRSTVYLELGRTVVGANDYKVVINSDRIIQDPAIPINASEHPGYNLLSSCVWIDGGDNVYIKGDLEGNNCLAIASRTAGGPGQYTTGNIVFEGNISSDIECISSCVKDQNGNGWHNLIFKNGTIKTNGNGIFKTVVIRPGSNSPADPWSYVGWNSTNAGTNGYIQFINCVLYNANLTEDPEATLIISSGDYGDRILSYNTIMYVAGGDNIIITSNDSEGVKLSNTQGNASLGTNVLDTYGTYASNSALTILNY
jgi:hypothetical protein